MKLPTVELGLRRPLGIEQTVFNQPFWQGLSNGQFLLASCKNCSRRSFPPKAVCPGCHGEDFDWVPATGKGLIYSYTRIQTSPPIYELLTPSTLVVIDLEEDVRLLSRLLPNGTSGAVGMPCRLVITKHPDGVFFAAEVI